LIRKNVEEDVGLPAITAKSGKVYIYFYSDAAYNMSGFNITYRYVVTVAVSLTHQLMFKTDLNHIIMLIKS